jgi:peptide/nickel transport system permease protein
MADVAAEAALEQEGKRRPYLVEIFARLIKEKPLGVVGLVIVIILAILAIFADVIAPYGMADIHLGDRLTPPSTQYLLGTDNLGRDMLSRIIHGARISVVVGIFGAALDVTITTLIGVVSGFLGGKVDLVVQRFVDAWICFPVLFIYLTVMSIVGPGLLQVILVISIVDGIRYSRVMRGAVIGIKENVYVEAARAIGASNIKILIRHILPNVMAPIIIIYSITCGYMILAEATLSFLGFGIPPPQPSWGGMLSYTGRRYMFLAPWTALWPGLALALVVWGLNMFGDAIRDILDPRLRGGLGRYGRSAGLKAGKQQPKEQQA